MRSIRKYLPTMLGGVTESTDEAQPKSATLAILKRLINEELSLNPSSSEPLGQLVEDFKAAEKALDVYVTNFQNLANQIKLPEPISPTNYVVDVKAEPPSDDSSLKQVSARLLNELNRGLKEIEPLHKELIAMETSPESVLKKDKILEIELSLKAIEIARKLRNMSRNMKIIIKKVFLSEEIGVHVLIPTENLKKLGKEVLDELLELGVQGVMDQFKDKINKFCSDFLRVSKRMEDKIKDIKRQEELLAAVAEDKKAKVADKKTKAAEPETMLAKPPGLSKK